jgi:TatD DNase family protein
LLKHQKLFDLFQKHTYDFFELPKQIIYNTLKIEIIFGGIGRKKCRLKFQVQSGEIKVLCRMQLIDTHTHLFLKEFEQDLPDLVQRARRVGVTKFLLPNIDVDSLDAVLQACRKFPEFRPMWGLHPCSVNANWQEDLERIRPFFGQQAACAVGEIGLDFYWSTEFEKEQILALETQLDWALEFGLPVSLHTRNATREAIQTLKPFIKKGLKGVFHCFSGTEEEAREILEMGLQLGIGGSITYPKNPLRNFLKNLPPERLVLETDAPYLPPVPYRGKRNEPAYLQEVVYELAGIYQIPPAQIAEITSRNAESVFNL